MSIDNSTTADPNQSSDSFISSNYSITSNPLTGAVDIQQRQSFLGTDKSQVQNVKGNSFQLNNNTDSNSYMNGGTLKPNQVMDINGTQVQNSNKQNIQNNMSTTGLSPTSFDEDQFININQTNPEFKSFNNHTKNQNVLISDKNSDHHEFDSDFDAGTIVWKRKSMQDHQTFNPFEFNQTITSKNEEIDNFNSTTTISIPDQTLYLSKSFKSIDKFIPIYDSKGIIIYQIMTQLSSHMNTLQSNLTRFAIFDNIGNELLVSDTKYINCNKSSKIPTSKNIWFLNNSKTNQWYIYGGEHSQLNDHSYIFLKNIQNQKSSLEGSFLTIGTSSLHAQITSQIGIERKGSLETYAIESDGNIPIVDLLAFMVVVKSKNEKCD
ncbi:hypothetical protein CROQUDRAFT_674085 [Cronartium quercuum f. sp. fusiforme G11]|uniref:Uncharacterized protein n=1 Tax=Cronartium quercuum f. sp. fusiforme G11 TaxID=708437 RepID=A0A9P6NC30_9BASI|nr:hypothetical protein CROQUDRAFT_674085 [Cronartium quercuum f. sp. fusiforme G11]